MYIYKQHHYWIHIVTNPEKTVLYTGVTNDLPQRLTEHWVNRGKAGTFAGKYYCYNLIYCEYFPYINNAILREKEIKKWRREKKIKLIEKMNPEWNFLNAAVCKTWPPKKVYKRE